MTTKDVALSLDEMRELGCLAVDGMIHGHFHAAIQMLDHLAVLCPEHRFPFLARCVALVLSGRAELALLDLEKAHALWPQDESVRALLGLALHYCGRMQLAGEYLSPLSQSGDAMVRALARNLLASTPASQSGEKI